tara:strand:+ start:4502 stop:5224 length:723 start_codon:yes stop_codon:yes gene_type:complete
MWFDKLKSSEHHDTQSQEISYAENKLKLDFKPLELKGTLFDSLHNSSVEKKAITTERNQTNKLQKWMQHTPQFKFFLEFREKALKTQEEIDNFKNMINKRDMIDTAKQFLTIQYDANEALDLIEEKARFNSVNYLSAVITGMYPSSQLEYAIETVQEVISTPISSSISNKDVRKSLLGDKIELGIKLYLYHLQQWHQVKEGAVDEKTQKLLFYIEQEAKKKAVFFKNNARYITERLKQHD